MSFEFDLVAFESLMLIYITYSAVMWGISHLIRFLR